MEFATVPTQDEKRNTQNYGILVESEYGGKQCDFYGNIKEIWEVQYLYWHIVILFKCAWYISVDDRKMHTGFHRTSIDVSLKCYKDDPFVLATQVKQVYYLDDRKKGNNWKVVRKVNHRHIWDTPSTSKTGEDGGEEDIVVINAEAYQEETSNDINVTFD
ncbi:hypothetical protein TIFTF001_016362 [Ficus carica]|uniref:DUF4216 domain-containing protein n=1 Tax=Ficus carica TaxID=3494 RepID=A0AA88D639_FICCA|nr:hypothetical protein TIFTF001_016362 [Ficus carica]